MNPERAAAKPAPAVLEMMMPINLTCPLCRKSNGFHNVELLCDRVIELATSTIQCPLCPVVALNILDLATHLRDHKVKIKTGWPLPSSPANILVSSPGSIFYPHCQQV